MTRIKWGVAAILCCLTLPSLFCPVAAQQYPNRPIRFLVPFAPGGGNDIIGRIIAQSLSEALNQTIVVDNRSGAGGTIGSDLVAKAPPDGHTMLINNISLAVNATLIPKLPYDTLKDFAPVSIIGRQPNIMVVHPGVTAQSVQGFLDMVRAKPGQVNYASGGVGSGTHLAIELLQLTTKTTMTHIPYKGVGPALFDLIGGRVEMMISTMASALPHLKSGKLRSLAVTTVKRSSFFPEVPTMIEAGVRDYDFTTWYALFVPARTPQRVVARLNAELAKIAASPAVKSQFYGQGLETASTTASETRVYLGSEIDKWGKVIKAADARPE